MRGPAGGRTPGSGQSLRDHALASRQEASMAHVSLLPMSLPGGPIPERTRTGRRHGGRAGGASEPTAAPQPVLGQQGSRPAPSRGKEGQTCPRSAGPQRPQAQAGPSPPRTHSRPTSHVPGVA